MNNTLIYGGIRIISSPFLTKLVQKKHHKKKRIDKKWLKRYGYISVPDDTKAYLTTLNGSQILMVSEKTFKLLEKKYGISVTKETENE